MSRIWIPCALVAGALLAGPACAPKALRGGPGTENPGLDEPAMSTGLDRADIEYLVSENLGPLFASRFWTRDVEGRVRPPLVAIWPIENATTQHLDDEMLTLLSSVETRLVASGDVRVVAKSRQDALVREIGIQQGAAYDPRTAQRLGRQLGAEYFLTGKLTAVDERHQKSRRLQYTLFLQVLEVETGLVAFQHESKRSKAIKR